MLIGFDDFQNYFQQNKDWNSAAGARVMTGLVFQDYFQQNKDWNWVSDTIYVDSIQLPELLPAK